MDLEKKLDGLKIQLSSMGSALVAFSGGADSTLLLAVAHQILGDRLLGVIASADIYPAKETELAEAVAQSLQVKHLVIRSHQLEDKAFSANPRKRCYICKKILYKQLLKLAKQNGLAYVLDGANADDLSDFRPGAKASSELGIRSPLQEAGLTKDDVRQLSRRMNLPTWDKPAEPCLATRFPFGARLNAEDLRRVEQAEEFLAGLGFVPVRVRVHGVIARIETSTQDIPKIAQIEMADKIVQRLKALGYFYVTVDLEGYRMGNMNEPMLP